MELPIIQNKIFEVKGHKVMLDYDLAELYEVETKVLNQAVKRNPDRFPDDFMFQLNKNEWDFLKSQIVTSKTETRGGTQKLPYAFTEHGVTMLASVLRSPRAVLMSVAIVRAFIAIKQIINNQNRPNKELADKVNLMFERLGEHDVQLSQIYNALESMLDKEADKTEEKLKWEERERIGFKKTK